MQNQKIKIDIGCGKNKREGFIGIDIDRTVKPDIVASALNLPFKDNSVDEINSFHLVEHFNYQEAQIFFDEVYRVLKNGGKATIKADKDWTKRRLLSKDKTHKYRYKTKEILKMTDKFSIKEVRDEIYFFSFYQPRRKIFIKLVK